MSGFGADEVLGLALGFWRRLAGFARETGRTGPSGFSAARDSNVAATASDLSRTPRRMGAYEKGLAGWGRRLHRVGTGS